MAEGKAAYQSGDYATATKAFGLALELQPTPEAQYWLAMSLDLQGRPDEAVTSFEKLFANPAHPELGPELLDPARARYELLKQIPATVLLQVSPADASVEVDGAPLSGGAPHSLKLQAGTHTIKVTREGFTPLEKQLEVGAAQSVEHTLELSAAPAAEAQVVAAPAAEAVAPPPPPAEPRSMVPAYVTLGVAGASAVLGTIFGIQALGAKSDFEDNPTADNADDVERNALIADMAWGVALTLGITGVVLLTSDEPATPESGAETGRVKLAPYVSKTGGGASAHWTF